MKGTLPFGKIKLPSFEGILILPSNEASKVVFIYYELDLINNNKISPFAKLMSEPRPSFFSRILKSGSPFEQTVTTISRKLNFSGFA